MARFMRTDLGPHHSQLHPPAVVGEGIVFPPIQGYLFPISDVQTRIRKHTVSRLRPPTVVTQAQPFIQLPLNINLTPKDAVWRRNNQRMVQSNLRKPTVIDLSPQTKYLSVNLAYYKRVGTAKSRLNPPAVVTATGVFYGPVAWLAYSVRKRGAVDLRPPTLIDLRPQVYYLAVALAPSKRGAPKSTLHAPAVVSTGRFFGPSVTLAPSRRPIVGYGLGAPAVVDLPEPVLYPVSVTLAYSLRGKAKPFLRRPAVVGAAVYFGPEVHLTYSRRGVPKSDLRAPVVIDLRPQTVYLAVTLTYSRRGRPLSFLQPPTVIDSRIYFGPVAHLTYSRRGVAKSTLHPPVIPPLAEPTRVTLAYSVRGVTTSRLAPPAVIDFRPQTYYLTINLTYSRRGRSVSLLFPPAAVDRRIYFGPEVKLAYSRRGRPVYELRPPTVIDVRPQTYYLNITLAPSRRGRPMHLLRPAILAQAKQYDAVFVRLAYSVRKRGRAVLRRPVVVYPFFARPTVVSLAPQSRGVAKSQLLPPAVVRERENRPLTIVFVRTRPRPTTRFLRPPTVVRVPENRPTRVTLTQIAPRPTVTLLNPPTVVSYPPVETNVRTWLTYQTRGVAQYGLAAPTVINPAPLAEPIAVTLVRIRPPARFWRLSPPAVVTTFVPPGGEVCDFTSTDTEICDDTTTVDEVCDTTDTGSLVVGSDTTESRITGADTAVDEVCDSNEKAT